MPAATALVLAGGGSRRFGRDKLTQSFGAATVLDALLSDLPQHWPVVVVGPQRETVRDVRWVEDAYPDGGPVAGIAAGLREVADDTVVVLAGDLPFAGPWAARLASELGSRPELDAVAASAGDGPLNPLFAAYHCAALRSVLPADPRDAAARSLLRALRHGPLAVPSADALDVDTPEALDLARRRLSG